MVHELQVHQIELELQNEELRRAQEELQASRARYFDLYDLAPVGYLTVSGQGLIVEANLTAAALLGIPRSALVNRPFTDFVLREDQNLCPLQRARLLGRGALRSWEMRMSRPGGLTFWAHLEAVLADEGECRVTLSDITERKQAEATLALADARLRHLQKAESLARMGGSIAHHFNNKLQVVIGNLELATADRARVGGTDPVLEAAMGAAVEAAEMSTMMLTVVGIGIAAIEPLDLSRICRDMLPLLRHALPPGMHLETDLRAASLMIRGQKEQICQMLINLVTNAGESAEEGLCTVRLTLTPVPSPAIPAENRFPIDWAPESGEYACLEVADTGRGIAARDIEKIFDPFFSDKFIGRGLGLAVVLGILRVHGGAVAVQSKPGRGTTFQVFLPLTLVPARR